MTVDRNEAVMEMVEETLREDPDVSNEELRRKAAEIDSDIEELSARQFNARYPLQVKRKMSPDGAGTGGDGRQKAGSPETETEAAEREAIREGLLRFARDVADAEDKVALIDVLTRVDAYVDEVAEELGL